MTSSISSFLTLEIVLGPLTSLQLYHIVFLSEWSLLNCHGDGSVDTLALYGLLVCVGLNVMYHRSFLTLEIQGQKKSKLKVHLLAFSRTCITQIWSSWILPNCSIRCWGPCDMVKSSMTTEKTLLHSATSSQKLHRVALKTGGKD